MTRLTTSALVLGALLLAPAAGLAFEPTGMLEIHYINPTTQAGVTLVIGPTGTTVLMDAGKAGDTIPDYLNDLELYPGVDHIDYTIAGHLDADHIRGFKDVIGAPDDMEKYNVLYANYYDDSAKRDTQTILDYLAAVDETTAKGPLAAPLDIPPFDGSGIIDLGDGAILRFVARNGDLIDGTHVTVSDENDRSVAVLITYGGFDYVWASDLGGGDDEECTDRNVSSKNVEGPLAEALTDDIGAGTPLLTAEGVDVLNVSHHGAANSTNCRWMKLLRPEVAVMQTGNKDGNPEPVVVDGILRVGAAGPDCPCLDDVFPALVLQTDEGDFDGEASTTGYVVGDLVISTDGHSYWLDATGEVRDGSPDERAAAGLGTVKGDIRQFLVDDEAPGCPMEQVLPDDVVFTTESWKAKHRILTAANSDFTVGAGADVLLEAGTRVELGDGFSVETGGSLTVTIRPLTDCSDPDDP